jgi:hypothetical protein
MMAKTRYERRYVVPLVRCIYRPFVWPRSSYWYE